MFSFVVSIFFVRSSILYFLVISYGVAWNASYKSNFWCNIKRGVCACRCSATKMHRLFAICFFSVQSWAHASFNVEVSNVSATEDVDARAWNVCEFRGAFRVLVLFFPLISLSVDVAFSYILVSFRTFSLIFSQVICISMGLWLERNSSFKILFNFHRQK